MTLPGRNLAGAVLTRHGGDISTLLDGPIDRLDRQAQHGTGTGRDRGAQVGHLVDSVLMERHPTGQGYLNLISGGDAADLRPAIGPCLLSDRDHRRDVIAGM